MRRIANKQQERIANDVATTQFNPTAEQRKQVTILAALGHMPNEICLFIKDESGKQISARDIETFFADELATGLLKATVKVEQLLYSKALAGDVASMKAWLKYASDVKDRKPWQRAYGHS